MTAPFCSGRRRAKGKANRLDGLTARIGQTPSQNRLRAGRKSNRFAIERRKAVVCAIDEGAHADEDRSLR